MKTVKLTKSEIVAIAEIIFKKAKAVQKEWEDKNNAAMKEKVGPAAQKDFDIYNTMSKDGKNLVGQFDLDDFINEHIDGLPFEDKEKKPVTKSLNLLTAEITMALKNEGVTIEKLYEISGLVS